jgi:excisionase family DNA binding protein
MALRKAPLDTPPPPDIWTISQVARYLQLNTTTVRNQAKLGVIPGKQFGTLWRFSRKAVMALMGDDGA